MIRTLFDWAREHHAVLLLMGGASVGMILLSLVVIPILLVNLPDDYFAEGAPPPRLRYHRHPAARVIMLGVKNVAGLAFLLAGALLLMLPGQGILTMLIGLMLLNFPGKRRLEMRVIRRPAVYRSVNWIRGRFGRGPIRL